MKLPIWVLLIVIPSALAAGGEPGDSPAIHDSLLDRYNSLAQASFYLAGERFALDKTLPEYTILKISSQVGHTDPQSSTRNGFRVVTLPCYSESLRYGLEMFADHYNSMLYHHGVVLALDERQEDANRIFTELADTVPDSTAGKNARMTVDQIASGEFSDWLTRQIGISLGCPRFTWYNLPETPMEAQQASGLDVDDARQSD